MSNAKFLMQAANPDGVLVTWRASLPDWTAEHAPTLLEGSWSDITVAGGGFETPDIVPDGAMTFEDGSYVVFDDGSFAITY